LLKNGLQFLPLQASRIRPEKECENSQQEEANQK
jgi:hypothetical protein